MLIFIPTPTPRPNSTRMLHRWREDYFLVVTAGVAKRENQKKKTSPPLVLLLVVSYVLIFNRAGHPRGENDRPPFITVKY
jgi:hypothetical protein